MTHDKNDLFVSILGYLMRLLIRETYPLKLTSHNLKLIGENERKNFKLVEIRGMIKEENRMLKT